jgi:hypothetical protein
VKRPEPAAQTAQAWVELNAEDPEAVSAHAVARERLEAGRGLAGVRRLRLIELSGALPGRAELEALLRRSTRFYNPHKERCSLRLAASERAPVEAGDQLVRVIERGAGRAAAAERWWRHETGSRIEVREGIVWVLTFESGVPAGERAAELAWARERRRGLFCNPHSQDGLTSGAEPPIPWLEETAAAPEEGS